MTYHWAQMLTSQRLGLMLHQGTVELSGKSSTEDNIQETFLSLGTGVQHLLSCRTPSSGPSPSSSSVPWQASLRDSRITAHVASRRQQASMGHSLFRACWMITRVTPSGCRSNQDSGFLKSHLKCNTPTRFGIHCYIRHERAMSPFYDR